MPSSIGAAGGRIAMPPYFQFMAQGEHSICSSPASRACNFEFFAGALVSAASCFCCVRGTGVNVFQTGFLTGQPIAIVAAPAWTAPLHSWQRPTSSAGAGVVDEFGGRDVVLRERVNELLRT